MQVQNDLLEFTGCVVENHLGRSKLGVTYQVKHPKYGTCALKYFRGKITENQKFFQRLIDEIEIAKEIRHPNFANIYEVATEPTPYLLREFVPGMSLEKYLCAGALPSFEATQMLIDTILGMQAASNFGILHKNLKPSNLIVSPNNSVKVTGFLMPASYHSYFSPEHCNDQKLSRSSDVYSLGVIFYSVLTGSVPFDGSLQEVKKMHVSTPYPAVPNLPPVIKKVLDRAMSKDPKKRYPNFMEFLQELREIALSPDIWNVPKNTTVSKDSVTFSLTGSTTFSIKEKKTDALEQLVGETSSFFASEDSGVGKTGEFPTIRAGDYQEEKVIYTLEDIKKIQVEKSFNPAIPLPTKLDPSFPPVVSKMLALVVGTKNLMRDTKILSSLSFSFPKNLKEKVVSFLNDVLRQECWLVKESEIDDNFDITIDLEEAKTLRYYNSFSSSIYDALAKMPELSVVHKTIITKVEEWDKLNEQETNPPSFSSHSVKYSAIDTLMSLKHENILDLEDKKNTVIEGSPLENWDGQSTIIGTPPSSWDEQNTVIETPTPFSEKNTVVEHDKNWDKNTVIEKPTQAISIENQDQKVPKDENTFLKTIEEEEEWFKEESGNLEIIVNFNNSYQTRAWLRLVQEFSLERGKHFSLKYHDRKQKNLCFEVNLHALQECQRKLHGLSSVREFFQSDYEISRLDHGGMATVLKLLSKNESTIIPIRRENNWARQYFSSHLRTRTGTDGQECVYALIPKQTELVLKVAFEGNEEALIHESRLLSSLAKDSELGKHVIGMIQEGSFLGSADNKNEERLGYYIILEFASEGNVEQFCHRFLKKRLPVSIAFYIMYRMVLALQGLKAKGIIHRDIKPQNILVCEETVPKLSDFGLSITVEDASTQLNEERRRLLRLVDKEFLQISREKEQSEIKLKKQQNKTKDLIYPAHARQFEKISWQIIKLQNSIEDLIKQEQKRAEGLKKRYRPMSAEEIALKQEFAGSLIYAAPEQFSPSKLLTCQCDIYQLGAVIYTILTGRSPIQQTNIRDVMSQIMFGEKPKISDVIKSTPLLESISDLVHTMMRDNPEQRPKPKEIKERMDQMLLKHMSSLEADLRYPKADFPSKTKLTKWEEKVEYAKKIHKICVPYLREAYQKAEQEREKILTRKIVAKKEEDQLLKTVYLYLSKGVIQEFFMIQCPDCSKKIKINTKSGGKKFLCPHCRSYFYAKRVEM